MKINAILWGAVLGGLAVAIGSFGAHALKPMLMAAGRAETFELAVRYQFYHALALLATGILTRLHESPLLHYSAVCFLVGTLFFSGSLYVLCFTGLGILGAVTPIGGIFFIAGWILLVGGANKK
jgi:uncharacterized membrane protein YgdD (TMEM256/DUF423 family)